MLRSGAENCQTCLNLRTRWSASFQRFEGFVVTFALEKMGELRIDRIRERGGEIVDLFRNGAETLRVFFRIAAAFFVADDGEALAQSGDKIGRHRLHNHEYTPIGSERFSTRKRRRQHARCVRSQKKKFIRANSCRFVVKSASCRRSRSGFSW
jgi:hypothetical protein